MRQYLNAYAAYRYPMGLTWEEMKNEQWCDLYDLTANGRYNLLQEYYDIENKFLDLYMMFYDYFSITTCNGRKFTNKIMVQLTDYSKKPFYKEKIDYRSIFYYDIPGCFYQLQALFKRNCSTYSRKEYEFLIRCHLRDLTNVIIYSEDGINRITNSDAGSMSLSVELHHTIKLTDIFEHRDGIFFCLSGIQRFLFDEDAEKVPEVDLPDSADEYGNIDLRTFHG